MLSQAVCVTFNNGCKCPILGLGTYKMGSNEVCEALSYAIDIGYRHFDTAFFYRNESKIGEVLTKKIEGGIKREEFFITSKLWNDSHKRELVGPALKCSLKNLCLSYLDLYLIHWPMGYKEGDELSLKGSDHGPRYSDSHFTETWEAMEECAEQGLAKSIGLSNFNSQQVQEIVEMAKIKPVVNQVECHIYLNQEKLLNFCKNYSVHLTGYSPLGSPGNRRTDNQPEPLKDEKVICIAEKYNKTPAQILIRFQIQRGIIVIPKSANKVRIKENLDALNFELNEDDMDVLKSLNRNERIATLSKVADHKDYPFNIEY